MKPPGTNARATRFFSAAGLSCALSFCFVCGASPQKTTPSPEATLAEPHRAIEGRPLFESRCASCHGLDGRGGERAPNIVAPSVAQRRSDAAIARIISAGIPSTGMPAFAALDASTLRSLVAYLRFLQGNTRAARFPGDPQRGKSLFFGKARCAECHTLAGAGGFLGSDLSSYARSRQIAEIRRAIIDPGKTSRAAVTTIVTTRGGQKFAGIARNEDNFSLQLQASDGAFHLFLKSELAGIARENAALMPADYAATLSVGELNDLIASLMSTSGRGAPVAKVFKEDEENE